MPDSTNPAWPDQASSSVGDIHTEPAVGMIQVIVFLFSIFPWCWGLNTEVPHRAMRLPTCFPARVLWGKVMGSWGDRTLLEKVSCSSWSWAPTSCSLSPSRGGVWVRSTTALLPDCQASFTLLQRTFLTVVNCTPLKESPDPQQNTSFPHFASSHGVLPKQRKSNACGNTRV